MEAKTFTELAEAHGLDAKTMEEFGAAVVAGALARVKEGMPAAEAIQAAIDARLAIVRAMAEDSDRGRSMRAHVLRRIWMEANGLA